jgi:hypothetical protein
VPKRLPLFLAAALALVAWSLFGFSFRHSIGPQSPLRNPSPGPSVTALASSSSDTKFGWIENVSKDDSGYHLYVHLAEFIRDDFAYDGYRTVDLHEVKDFPVASSTTIRLQSDALTRLIDSGLTEYDSTNYENRPHFATFAFVNLANRLRRADSNYLLTDAVYYHFVVKDHVVVEIQQQYVP